MKVWMNHFGGVERKMEAESLDVTWWTVRGIGLLLKYISHCWKMFYIPPTTHHVMTKSSALGAQPSGIDIFNPLGTKLPGQNLHDKGGFGQALTCNLVPIALRDLSSELMASSAFHSARESYGLVVNSIGRKKNKCGTSFLRHAHFRYNLLSIKFTIYLILHDI